MVNISPDLIILGLIAGVILFRLYSVLGKKDDDSITTPNKMGLNNIIDISSTAKSEDMKQVNLAELEKDIAPEFNDVIEKIRKLDTTFSLQKFLNGAKKAFEMILASFSSNDRNILKSLLSPDVYNQFIKEIDNRLKNNINLSLTLVSLPVVEIKNIQLDGKKVIIDMFFVSQQITLLKNDQNEIVEGNPSQIDNVEDVWRFSRELNSKENWLLINVNNA